MSVLSAGGNVGTSAALSVRGDTTYATHGYYELFSSLPADVYWACLILGDGSADDNLIISLATGAASSETSLVEVMSWANGGLAPLRRSTKASPHTQKADGWN